MEVTRRGGKPTMGTSHAQLSFRQRKRIQVGVTNVAKHSFEHTHRHHHHKRYGSCDADECNANVARNLNVSDAIMRTCESNLDLVKASKSRSTSSLRSELKSLGVQRRGSTSQLSVSKDKTRKTTRQLLSSNGTRSVPQLPRASMDNLQDASGSASSMVDDEALEKYRQQLSDAFISNYGSMRAVFRAFDPKNHGLISIQRFHEMAEVCDIDLSRSELELLYRKADANGDNAIAFDEFVNLFATGDQEHVSSFDPSSQSNVAYDPSSSCALKFRPPLPLTPHSRMKMNQLRDRIVRELFVKHGHQVSVHSGKVEQLLVHAFKQFDADADGYLSYEELQQALGKDFLKLNISDEDTIELAQNIDRDGDKKLSMRELSIYFAMGNRKPAFDMIGEARAREVTCLREKVEAPSTPREEVDPEYFARRAKALADANTPAIAIREDLASGCMQENLAKRIAASPIFEKQIECQDVAKIALQKSPSLSPTMDGLKAPPLLNELEAVSQDRFRYKRMEWTDWTRIGYGGNGVATDSALYLPETDRFVSTNARLLKPLMHDNDSLAAAEAKERKSKREFRYERTQRLLSDMREQREQDIRIKEWKQRARVKEKARQKFGYLTRVHADGRKSDNNETVMQKRHGGAASLRMWAGSADSPFNQHHHSSPHIGIVLAPKNMLV